MITKEQARQNLSDNLKWVIANKEVKQADLAVAIRVNGENMQTVRQRVYRYVHGQSDVVGDDLVNMAEYLEVSADWLLAPHRRKKNRKVG